MVKGLRWSFLQVLFGLKLNLISDTVISLLNVFFRINSLYKYISFRGSSLDSLTTFYEDRGGLMAHSVKNSNHVKKSIILLDQFLKFVHEYNCLGVPISSKYGLFPVWLQCQIRLFVVHVLLTHVNTHTILLRHFYKLFFPNQQLCKPHNSFQRLLFSLYQCCMPQYIFLVIKHSTHTCMNPKY